MLNIKNIDFFLLSLNFSIKKQMNDSIPIIPNTIGKYTNSSIIIESIILYNKFHTLSYKTPFGYM